MEKQLSILLVYEPAGKKPVAVARIDSTRILLRVAEAAIGEAQARAVLFGDVDQVLGDVEREEAKRLKNVLHYLLPELGRSDDGDGADSPEY
jgi:metallophosphoesterase superfamily enzyme